MYQYKTQQQIKKEERHITILVGFASFACGFALCLALLCNYIK
jgi:hypothetical protein